jgi:hypothetical protein
MKITKEMTMELNNELAVKGCPFRYKYEEVAYSNNPHIEIILPSMHGVSSFIINPTKGFFTWIKHWFGMRGIEISFNNTGSIMWSADGWDED